MSNYSLYLKKEISHYYNTENIRINDYIMDGIVLFLIKHQDSLYRDLAKLMLATIIDVGIKGHKIRSFLSDCFS